MNIALSTMGNDSQVELLTKNGANTKWRSLIEVLEI